MPAPTLKYLDFAPKQPYHAAFVALRGDRAEQIEPHDHDFWEVMYVFEGAGEHHCSDTVLPLCAGSLTLVRPWDLHSLTPGTGAHLQFFNVAFLAEAWQAFLALTVTEELLTAWKASTLPPVWQLPEPNHHALQAVCGSALHVYQAGPSLLARADIWLSLLSAMLPSPAEVETAPRWLRTALQQMEQPDLLRAGLPALLSLCGVSATHLARTVRTHYGATPTELVGRVRLDRAAQLLRGSALDVSEVASECGFENLSYFYRLFKLKYGTPPAAYQLHARRGVGPS